MVDRRQAIALLAGMIGAEAVPSQAMAQAACAVLTPATQQAVTPEAALARLKEGNERFISGRTLNCDLMKQVKETATHQSPIAAIVGCIDSRVAPELVFDQRIGDIFAARVAGNFVNTDIIGSLEFATAVAGARLIVVLGHGECGAIKGAIDNVQLGNLTSLLQNIRPSMEKLGYSRTASSKDKQLVQKLADQNAKDAVQNLLARSEVISGLVKEGKLKVVAAMHDVSTGRISWFA